MCIIVKVVDSIKTLPENFSLKWVVFVIKKVPTLEFHRHCAFKTTAKYTERELTLPERLVHGRVMRSEVDLEVYQNTRRRAINKEFRQIIST